jgi:hypothetical protein
MQSWEMFLYGYLAIGVLCAAVLAMGAWLAKPRDTAFSRDLIAALDERRRSFWYRLLSDRFVPALATVLIMLVWPVAVLMGIKDFLARRRDRRSLAK